MAGSHAAALVGVEGDIVDLDGDAAGRGSLLEVKSTFLDADVLAGYNLPAGMGKVRESLVLCHDCCGRDVK